jgi:hypothetical protein
MDLSAAVREAGLADDSSIPGCKGTLAARAGRPQAETDEFAAIQPATRHLSRGNSLSL